MENTAGKIFTELKEDISTYARLKLRLLKLMAIERTAIVLAVLSHSLISVSYTHLDVYKRQPVHHRYASTASATRDIRLGLPEEKYMVSICLLYTSLSAEY